MERGQIVADGPPAQVLGAQSGSRPKPEIRVTNSRSPARA